MFDYLSADWSKLLEPEIIYFRDKSEKERRLRIKGAFKELVYRRSTYAQRGNGKDVVFLKSMYRRDYNHLFDQIFNCCDRRKAMIDARISKEAKFSLYWVWIALRYFPIFFLIRAGSLMDWFYLLVRAIRVMEWYHLLRGFDFNTLVVFADMQMLDNLIVQLGNLRSKRTATLQHGLYVDYSDHFNVNIVNYKNVVAQDFLAWGQNTKNLIKKYHPNVNVIVCGKPLEPREIKVNDHEYFTLICDQNVFFDYNREILKLAYEFSRESGLKVNLRMHPNNRIQWFDIEDSFTVVDQDIWDSAFVIGHTSSLLYECLRLGVLSFKYNTPVPSIEMPPELCFSDANDLKRCYELTQHATDAHLEYGENYIEYVDEESLARYKDYFDALHPLPNRDRRPN